ncbi:MULTISPECIES: DNA-binding response regulator [unclassified Rhizobium]|uniref:DNA-binding response regulator n=1 Tax=unclassified Rhizobium TaxID=2613769 RepID=UPI00381E9EEC
MNARKVKPLTKRRSDGALYTRRSDIEEALAKLVKQSREEIIAALKIRDTSSPLYVKSECIVYLIRDTRYDNDESYFNDLYRELMRRLSAALPRVVDERADMPESVHAADARDRVRDTFVRKLIEDRAEPGSALDYFEVMFAGAIAALRTTSMHRARRQAGRTEAIEADQETNEPSLAVERAVGSLDLKEELLSDDPIYRSRVADAIRSLPDKLRRVVELIMRDMPIDSSDDSVMTIRKAIGVKSEKTVRNRRDEAYLLIRQALSIGDDHD